MPRHTADRSEHLMIVPSLACPTSCEYCFGPHEGNGTMPISVVKDITSWQRNGIGRIGLEG